MKSRIVKIAIVTIASAGLVFSLCGCSYIESLIWVIGDNAPQTSSPPSSSTSSSSSSSTETKPVDDKYASDYIFVGGADGKAKKAEWGFGNDSRVYGVVIARVRAATYDEQEVRSFLDSRNYIYQYELPDEFSFSIDVATIHVDLIEGADDDTAIADMEASGLFESVYNDTWVELD